MQTLMRCAAHGAVLTMIAATSVALAAPVEVELDAQVIRKVANDTVTMSLYAEAEGPDASTVTRRLEGDAAPVLKTLQANKALRVRTTGLATYPVYEKTRLARWRGRYGLEVESNEIGQAASVLEKTAPMLIGSTYFSISPAKRRVEENAAIDEAMKALRERADALRKATGHASYELKKLRVNYASAGPSYAPAPMARSMAVQAAEDRVIPPMEAGEGNVTVTLSAVAILLDK